MFSVSIPTFWSLYVMRPKRILSFIVNGKIFICGLALCGKEKKKTLFYWSCGWDPSIPLCNQPIKQPVTNEQRTRSKLSMCSLCWSWSKGAYSGILWQQSVNGDYSPWHVFTKQTLNHCLSCRLNIFPLVFRTHFLQQHLRPTQCAFNDWERTTDNITFPSGHCLQSPLPCTANGRPTQRKEMRFTK